MAGIIANTLTKYGVVGQREQLADIIYNISPEDTPFVSRAGKENVKGTTYEWQCDSLAAVDTTNAQLEGDDVTVYPATTSTTRLGNTTQISRKLLIISGTAEVTEKAGRKSETAYQLAKRGSELKRDIEGICWENQGADLGGTATPRKTATLGAFVKTNVVKAGNGGNPTYTSGVPDAARTDGTQAALTETNFKAVAQLVWSSGGTLKDVFVGAFNKGVISGFTGVVTRTFDQSKAAPTVAIASVDVYVTDWGTLKVHPSRFQRARDCWFMDFDYVAIAHLRPFMTIPLAKTGDAEKKMLLQEWGLKVKQEAALGLVADCTES